MLKSNKLKYVLGFMLGTSLIPATGQELVGAIPSLNPPSASDNTNTMSEEETNRLLRDLMENNPFMAEAKVVMGLSMAAGVSENEFRNSIQTNLPIAPRNDAGDYYLDLDSPYKAVSLPTEVGHFAVNLEAMRLRQMAAEKQLEIDKKASIARGDQPRTIAKIASHPVNQVVIIAVSSAYFDDPATSDIELDAPGSSFNHGGSWVGAISQEIGNSNNFGINICGVAASLHSIGVTYYSNGQEAGMWRGMYTNGCQSGWMQSWATGSLGTFYSSPVHFN